MKAYLQRIGRSLMLPVATLPVAALFMGIGYWIDPSGWGGFTTNWAFFNATSRNFTRSCTFYGNWLLD